MRLYLAAGLSAWLCVAVCAAASGGEQFKAARMGELEKLGAAIANLQQERDCLAAAQDQNAGEACRELSSAGETAQAGASGVDVRAKSPYPALTKEQFAAVKAEKIKDSDSVISLLRKLRCCVSAAKHGSALDVCHKAAADSSRPQAARPPVLAPPVPARRSAKPGFKSLKEGELERIAAELAGKRKYRDCVAEAKNQKAGVACLKAAMADAGTPPPVRSGANAQPEFVRMSREQFETMRKYFLAQSDDMIATLQTLETCVTAAADKKALSGCLGAHIAAARNIMSRPSPIK
ncbi:MAG: hypothetical protein PHP45_03640 [Elusimicrobiales bacterium]|nr:hypothetical protein [Elusimicrobiales bacterium]